MVIPLVVAVALWGPGPITPIVVTVLALANPGPALVVLVGWALVSRLRRRSGPTPDDEARALSGLVAELEGGASPRSGLVRLADSSGNLDVRL